MEDVKELRPWEQEIDLIERYTASLGGPRQLLILTESALIDAVAKLRDERRNAGLSSLSAKPVISRRTSQAFALVSMYLDALELSYWDEDERAADESEVLSRWEAVLSENQ